MKKLLAFSFIFVSAWMLVSLMPAQDIQVVRVRSRSIAPPNTISNLVYWISADCISINPCATLADNTTLTTWADRSGQNNNIASFTGTCTLHTNQINTLPAVTFSSCHAALLDDTNNTIDSLAFTGSGLNDAVFAGFQGGNLGATSGAFCWQITTTGTPDKYSTGTGGSCVNVATGVSLTGAVQCDGTHVPCIKFGATTGHTLNDKWTTTVDNSGSDAVSVFAVVKMGTTAAQSVPISGLATNSFMYWFYGSATHAQGADENNVVELGFTTTLLGTVNWHQTNIVFADTASGVAGLAFRMDRAVAATTTESTANLTRDSTHGQEAIGWNARGATSLFNGQIAELIFYNKKLSSTEVTTVETYLNSRYGL